MKNNLFHLYKKNWFNYENTRSFIKKSIFLVSTVHPQLAAHIGLQAFTTPLQRKKRNHLLPKEVVLEYKTYAGKKIATYKYGHSPRKVLLVHGWEGAASDFSHFFKPLKQQHFEVHAIDLPGHGFSSHHQLNAIQAAEIIRRLEIDKGPFCAIVGHSFGAFSSGYAIAQHSEFNNIPFISIGSPNKLAQVLNNFANLVGFNLLQRNYIYSKIEKDL
ncbi:MAG: alpha/beta hydrolase, partial [Bdellovibrionales bacterium]|nr:alpha/beta hydrolase [Bdellovibrionales bacterium]